MKKLYKKIISILKRDSFIISTIIFIAILIPLHELGHYLTAKIFGVDGQILFEDWLASFRSIDNVSYIQMVLISLGGGILVALIYFILWQFIKELPIKLFIFASIGNAIGEVFNIIIFNDPLGYIGSVGFGLGLLLGLILSRKQFMILTLT